MTSSTTNANDQTVSSTEPTTTINKTTPNKKSHRNPPGRRSNSNEDLLQSIASKAPAVLLHPQVTLTCYIPTASVGAVIGRKGSTIVQIQKDAQQASPGSNKTPLRVSIVGHDDQEDVPYTYSALDWSSPHWTPLVIRGDPCAALTAARKLSQLCGGDMDECVLDLPLSRNKHSFLIGKRGVVLANLSADTAVRIMVPRKESKQDVVQLEGDLDNVQKCLESVLCLCEKKPSAQSVTITVQQLASQTKLRNISRKTETTIRKKKLPSFDGGGGGDSEDGSSPNHAWQLTISGNSADQIQQAIVSLERCASNNNNNNSAAATAAAATTTNADGTEPNAAAGPTTPRRSAGGGRGGKGRNNRQTKGGGRGNKGGKGSKETKEMDSPTPTVEASTATTTE